MSVVAVPSSLPCLTFFVVVVTNKSQQYYTVCVCVCMWLLLLFIINNLFYHSFQMNVTANVQL